MIFSFSAHSYSFDKPALPADAVVRTPFLSLFIARFLCLLP